MKTEYLTLCRIRLAQRICFAISGANPEYLTDDHWMKAMVHLSMMRAKAEISRGTTAELKTLSRRSQIWIGVERDIGAPSDEETLQELEQKAAVNQ